MTIAITNDLFLACRKLNTINDLAWIVGISGMLGSSQIWSWGVSPSRFYGSHLSLLVLTTVSLLLQLSGGLTFVGGTSILGWSGVLGSVVDCVKTQLVPPHLAL